MTTLLMLFIAGFIWEVFATVDIQAVQQHKAFKSAFFTFILTYTSYKIFYEIFSSPDTEISMLTVALGCALGAYLTVRHGK